MPRIGKEDDCCPADPAEGEGRGGFAAPLSLLVLVLNTLLLVLLLKSRLVDCPLLRLNPRLRPPKRDPPPPPGDCGTTAEGEVAVAAPPYDDERFDPAPAPGDTGPVAAAELDDDDVDGGMGILNDGFLPGKDGAGGVLLPLCAPCPCEDVVDVAAMVSACRLPAPSSRAGPIGLQR